MPVHALFLISQNTVNEITIDKKADMAVSSQNMFFS